MNKKILSFLVSSLFLVSLTLAFYWHYSGEVPFFGKSATLKNAIRDSAEKCQESNLKLETPRTDSVTVYVLGILEKRLGLKFGGPPGYAVPEIVEEISIFSIPNTNTCWVAAVKLKGKSPKFIFEGLNGKIIVWKVDKVMEDSQ